MPHGILSRMSGVDPWPGGEAVVAMTLHRECIISVEALQRYPALVDAYPHRYLFLKPRLRLMGTRILLQLFTGVEILEARGWEAVSWQLGEGNGTIYGVVMRRMTPPQGHNR